MIFKNSMSQKKNLFLDPKKGFQWLLFLIIGLHALIKFAVLPELELQGDEAFSVFHAQQTVPELLQTLNKEANPPLYYLILHFWIKLFGIGLFAVKSLNIILSIGTAFFLFKLTKKVGNVWIIFSVSACFLFSNLHFDFSHEIRAFQLVLLLTAASYYVLLSFIETQKKTWLLTLVILNAAMPFSHYNAVLVPLVQFLGVLFYWNENKKIVVQLFLSYVFSALLFLPQLIVFKGVIPDENFWLGLSTWDDFKFIFAKVIGNDTAFLALVTPYFLSPIIMILGLKFKWFSEIFSWRIFLQFWMLFLIPLLLNYALAQNTPSFQVRYVLFTSFGLYLSIAYLFLNLEKGKWFVRSYFLFLILQFLYQFVPAKRDGEGWKETAEMVHSFQKRKVAIVISSSYKSRDFMYYYDPDAFNKYASLENSFKTNDIYPVMGVDGLSTMGNLKRFEKIILVLSHNEVQDPQKAIPAFFDKRFTLCYEIGDPIRAKIRLYNVGNTPCTSFKRLSAKKEKSGKCWFWEVSELKEVISGVQVRKNILNTKACGSYKVDSEIAFSPNREELVNDISIVDCELEFDCVESPSSLLVVSVENDGESFKRAEYKLSEPFLKGQKIISIKSSVLGKYPENTKVKVYVWNPSGPPLEIKRMSVQFWKK